jgi:hypothetical protein
MFLFISVIVMRNRTNQFQIIMPKVSYQNPLKILGEVAGKILLNLQFKMIKLYFLIIFRRKQLAPRSRLVRQCDLCDFSSSIINEFKNHMKFEHGQDQVFLCDTCRYYSLSSYDFSLHLNSHHDSSK